jgi:adhesin transport system membrane fusion protein
MSKRDWELVDFATGRDASQIGGNGRKLMPFLLLMVLIIGSGIAWANWAEIEEVARVDGRVVPSGRARGVESLEGGIVAKILVAEGDIVQAQQELIRIDDTGASAGFGELQAQQQALNARAYRLAVELGTDETLDFTATGASNETALALREIAVFDSRRASYISQRAVLLAQAIQRKQENTEARNSIARANEGLTLLDEEIALRETSGVVPRAQIIPIERERNAARQERDRLESQIALTEAALVEAEARLTELDLLRRAEINLQRSETLNQLSVIDESIKRASDVVARTTLRAPVPGIISALNVNTIGSVIAPGEEVLRIVPAEDGLEVEARLKPEDVAFVRLDLPAKVKLTAFDFTIYGALPGRVTRIGADVETDEATGQIYFPIIIQTDANELVRGDQAFEIRPGMIASVDILTGQRTVLDYLLKPFRKAKAEAMRER